MSDENEVNKDTLPGQQGQPSSKPNDPLATDPEVFTREEVDTEIRTRHSTLDRTIAEQKKEIDAGKLTAQRLQDAEVRLAVIEKERNDQEYEAIKGDPDLLASYRQKQELAAREASIRERETKVAEDEAAHRELLAAGYRVKTVEAAEAIAKEFGVDAKDLLELNPETPEQMKAFAGKLAKIAGKVKPDSGVGAGAGVDVKKMSGSEKILYGLGKDK